MTAVSMHLLEMWQRFVFLFGLKSLFPQLQESEREIGWLVEPLFGEGKQWHGMQRFRLRRLWRVNIEGLIRAAGQNIKRLLKARTWNKPLRPAGSAALGPACRLRPSYLHLIRL